MATLRNLPAGILNLPGRPSVAAACPQHAGDPARILPSRAVPPALARHDQ
jgi:hypothetical protein